MIRLSVLLALGVSVAPGLSSAQNLLPQQTRNGHSGTPDFASVIGAMKSAYAGSGNIVVLDNHTIMIEPNMPAPLCAVPKVEGGKTFWSYYAFPLASITVPLAIVDDKLIGQDMVFTDPDAAKKYKPGDAGDTAMVIIAGLPGKQFHTLAYDRDKLVHLGPGPHASSEYGEGPDDTEAFALTFPDRAAAASFATALKNAVLLARAQIAQSSRQQYPRPGSE